MDILATLAAPNTGQALYKAVLLMMVFNGDWRDESCVQRIRGNGASSPQTPESIQDLMESTIIAVACSTKPGLWPRSRWTGAELPLSQFGLLCAIHGIFLPAYAHWLERHSSASVATHVPHLEGQSSELGTVFAPDMVAGTDLDFIHTGTMENLNINAASKGDLLAAVNSRSRLESKNGSLPSLSLSS